MIRADMDALPVRENSGLSYASTKRQTDMYGVEQHVMHACGHDVHITSLLGTAEQLMKRKDRWSSTLVLISQPAEERVAGARAMLEDGLYNRFPKPDYALALHVASGIPLGKIVIYPNTAYSGADAVDIVVHGVAGHGASSHRSIDLVLVASQIVVSLQSIVSRSINSLEPGVITVGSIHGGTKRNIISDRVEMQITVRSDNFETRKALLDGIDRVAEGLARSLGVPDNLLPEVTRSEMESTPPTINDEESANLLRGAFEERFPPGTVIDWPRSGMGAEDFPHFVHPDHSVKDVYLRIGGTATKSTDDAPPHNSPLFRIKPEPPIKMGTEAMVVAAELLMRKN
jgi:amidohydrolase